MKMIDAMPARHPVNATLELTLRCNLKCKMCMFRHSDRENACLAAEELTSAQWADMAQNLPLPEIACGRCWPTEGTV